MTASLPSSLGEFRVEAILGQGGSGIVYDAIWGPRRVALKVLHPSLVGTERERAQFLAEAQRLQAIAHPSVVKVLAFGELPDARPYLAMERLDGQTLASVLAAGALPLTAALALFAELCDAVGALHAQGLVHRDLKPENVFVVDGTHAVLLDFGIAKELAAPASTTTQDGGVRGTPAYMAPERFFGQPAAIATDIYELAVTLYAMLAGRLPWDDAGDPEARLSPRSLVELAPVPAELDVEIRRAMSTRAPNRPASAAELLAAIRTAAEASGPAPESTARMRPAGDDAPRPWFADRQPTTDRGKTPLAYQATEIPRRTARAKWPWVAGALGIVAIAGVAWWQLHDRGDGAQAPAAVATPKPARPDPWAAPSVTTAPPAPEHARRPIADERAELAAAYAHFPADTQVVLGIVVDELRASPAIAPLLGKIAADGRVILLLATLPACVRDLATSAEWLAFGSTAAVAELHGTLMIRGPKTRSEIATCLAGEPLSSGHLDFVDDHTIYLSLRDDLDAAQVHNLATGGSGPRPKVAALLAAQPADRTIVIAAEAPTADGIPPGSDVAGWLRAESGGAAVDFAVDTHGEASAQALELRLRPQVEAIFRGLDPTPMGTLMVARETAVVHLRGRVTSALIGLVSSALQ